MVANPIIRIGVLRMNVSSLLAIKLDDFIERTASAFSWHRSEPRPGNEDTGRRFVKGSISVSEGPFGGLREPSAPFAFN